MPSFTRGYQVLKSGWIGWQMNAVDGDDDRVVTTANAVGLMFMLRGSIHTQWECSGQRKSSELSAGMVELRPADGLEHRYRYRWKPDSAVFTMQIPTSQWALILTDHESPSAVIHRHFFPIHDPVVDHCMRILFARQSDGADSTDEDAIARVLMIRLVELQGVPSPRWVTDSDPLPRTTVLLVRDFVDTNLGSAIELASMARIAGLSRGHFARTFRNTLGMSPGDFVRVRRVRAAFERVCNGHESLGEIAEDVGFSSQGHMTSAFVRFTGLTPGFVRRRGLRPLPPGVAV